MIVHGHGKNFLGFVLPYDVLVEPVLDFLRREQRPVVLGNFHLVAHNDVVAGLDAFVANARAVLHDEVAHLQFAAPAEGAAQRFADLVLIVLGHDYSLFS